MASQPLCSQSSATTEAPAYSDTPRTSGYIWNWGRGASADNLMIRNFTSLFSSELSRKGLFIIAVPILFSIIFIIGLKILFNEARAQADIEARSRIIVSSRNTLAAAIMKTISDRYMSRFLQQDVGEERFQESSAAVLERYRELHNAVKPDTPQAQVVDRMGLTVITAVNIMRSTDFAKRANMDVGELIDMFKKQRKMQVLMNSLLSDSDALAELERKTQNKPQLSYNSYRHIIDLLLFIGVTFDILLAVALMFYFGSDITRRLSVLMDNSKRLVEEKHLNPLVHGRDEISQLDRVFHNTADRLAEARARERAVLARLQSIINTIPLGLVVTDEHGRIVSIGPSAEKLFGYENAAIADQSIDRLFHMPDNQTREQALEDLLKPSPTVGREMQSQREEGSLFPSEVLSTLYHTSEMDGRLFVITDVTERHEIERMKQSFIAMVSHELRSPLTSVQVCLEMVKRNFFGPLNDMGQQSVKMAEQSTKRLLLLVNEILDVERLASGSIAVSPKPVSMNSILALSAGSVAGTAEAAGINIISSDSNIDLVADEDRIVQVLVNFLSNAIKFSPKGSTIGMSARMAGDMVEIKVRDQGRGIPEDQLQLVFERFHQVSRADNKEKGGAGLGLAICKAIVEAHGGEIGANSTVGVGSTFWLRIPKDGKDASQSTDLKHSTTSESQPTK